MAEPPSSPPSGDATADDALSWYKSQYEQLEHELAEFRESSRELEAELEKDLDAADKREQALREKAEAAEFEVEEWKRKYKESKAEANAAQNVLEKEITTLRDTNRTLQLKLRDIEVANDDFERQARNTTSSLEDLESKYNVSIERGVLLEEEIKIVEQERENMRVEAQRLREELSDLKIEADILHDKLKKQEERHLSSISTEMSVPESPTFDHSPISTTASSPLITTPPDMKPLSSADSLSELQEPPSPPMSDASATLPKQSLMRTPMPTMRRSRLPSVDTSVTPRPKALSASLSSSASRPLGSRVLTVTAATRTPTSRPGAVAGSHIASSAATGGRPAYKTAATNSLSHIRSLTAQMQRLEARVQSARSKLPAPIGVTPPRPSPRSSSGGGGLPMLPSSVTIRSRKRTAGSTTSSITSGATGDESAMSASFSSSVQGRQSRTATTAGMSMSMMTTPVKHMPRLSTSGIGRLSFGPLPGRDQQQQQSHIGESRPSSRASTSSYARPPSRADVRDVREMMPPRPMSRTSMAGARTPLGRPRSSLGGNLHSHTNSNSLSINGLVPEDEVDTHDYQKLRTPSRRGTYSRYEADHGLGLGIPTPSGIPMPGFRRQSGGSSVGIPVPVGQRASTSMK